MVNQNYDAGWTLVQGTGEVLSSNGVLGVSVPAGKQRIKLVYRSKAFRHGLGVGALTLLAMGLLWFFENRWNNAASSEIPSSI